MVSRTISVPAFRTTINGKNLYNFIINPRDLLSIAFVARRDVGRERYYQRIINKDRLFKIKKFIEDGGTFPNNIIVAFNPETKMKFHIENGPDYSSTTWPYMNIAYGTLEFPRDYRSCWIIDGQHRLYAFVNIESKFDFNMPITAFENLDVKDQRKFFLDINKNQKPVDPDLLWDLSGDVPNDKIGRISNVAKYLNTNKESPLKNLVYYPTAGIKNKSNKIKISALCIAIKGRRIADELTNQEVKNPLFDSEYDTHVKKVGEALIIYFKTIHKLFPTNWEKGSKGFILSNGGISVMLGLFEKIVSRIMLKEHRVPDKYNYDHYLNPLKKIIETNDDKILKSLRIRCTSEAGKSELLNEFILLIRGVVNDGYFGGEIKSIRFDAEILEVEKLSKEFIKKYLYNKDNKNWFKDEVDKISQQLYGKCKTRLTRNNLTEDKIYLQLTLGEAFDLISKTPCLFNKLIGEKKFSSGIQLQACLSNISQKRGSLTAHHTGAEVDEDDIDMLKVHIKQLKKRFEEGLKLPE